MDKIVADAERDIREIKERIEQHKAKIDTIRTDPKYTDPRYGEALRAERIEAYEQLIKDEESLLPLCQSNITYVSILKKMKELAKEQAVELLKKNESLDPLTADIENEDKPPRKVN